MENQDGYDFHPGQVQKQSTVMSIIDMVKSIALTRPFLLAIIAILIYKLWASNIKAKQTAVLTGVTSERASIKSQRLPAISVRNR